MTGHSALRTVPFLRLPEAPSWLIEPELGIWQRVVRDYELDEPGLALLELALSAMTRWRESRDVLNAEGWTVDGRYGKRPHPAIAVERDSRMAAIRAWRELDLEGMPLPAPKQRGR